MKQNQLMIYVHIPFCVRKCRYCDFLSFPGSRETQQAYIQALQREIKERAGEGAGCKVSSVFFGGGTPSVLPGESIIRIMETIRECYQLSPEAEITLEVNPGTLSPEKTRMWKEAGINRISMGVQSMDDALLAALGRIHRADTVEKSVSLIREAGFTRYSFDLMMGLPGQSLAQWMNTLERIMEFEPEHLSCYSLIVEEGTEFGDLYDQGQLILPPEETERTMYHETLRFLKERGLFQYEISNFAKPGAHSRHNVGYWERTPYLGFGLGAASLTTGNVRFHDQTSLSAYLADPSGREDEERLSKEDQMSEFMFLGLRKTEGIRIGEFARQFDLRPEEVFGEAIQRHLKDGLLCQENGRLFLSEKGLDLANQVFMDFV